MKSIQLLELLEEADYSRRDFLSAIPQGFAVAPTLTVARTNDTIDNIGHNLFPKAPQTYGHSLPDVYGGQTHSLPARRAVALAKADGRGFRVRENA